MYLSKIKPDDLQIGFDADWLAWQRSSVRLVLIVWLQSEVKKLVTELENVSPDELRGVQKQLGFLKKVLALVQKTTWKDEALPSTLEFLRTIEK